MSSAEQADAYFEEAELTVESADAIYNAAEESGNNLWAQVVKNGYDTIEQTVHIPPCRAVELVAIGA